MYMFLSGGTGWAYLPTYACIVGPAGVDIRIAVPDKPLPTGVGILRKSQGSQVPKYLAGYRRGGRDLSDAPASSSMGYNCVPGFADGV